VNSAISLPGPLRASNAETRKRMESENDGTWEWPWWEDPFHPMMIGLLGSCATAG
jgi:hypothetical protein